MSAWAYAAAILACGLGASGRHALGLARRPHQYPWPTLVANVVGSALLGAAAGAVHEGAPAWVLLVAGAGLAGGITTFSALALDTETLRSLGRRWDAVGYAGVTMAAGIGAAWLGWALLV